MGLPDERELIEALTAELTSEANRAGFGSDCAIVELDGTELVASVDGFAEPTHFPEGLPARGAGRLAGRAALADLASAGADVIGILAAYGIPANADRARVEGLAEGLATAVEEAGGEVLGGDTKPREELSLTVTALGTCPAGEAMTRDTAQVGDHLIVTGPLGGAGAALDRIEQGMDPTQAIPLFPPDRTAAGVRLRELGVQCAMDLSDGLADAAVAIAGASDVQVVVEREAIPLHPWAEGATGVEHALTTGGDYELVAAVPDAALDETLATLAGLEAEGLAPAVVGRIESGQGAHLVADGDARELSRGYEHGFGGADR